MTTREVTAKSLWCRVIHRTRTSRVGPFLWVVFSFDLLIFHLRKIFFSILWSLIHLWSITLNNLKLSWLQLPRCSIIFLFLHMYSFFLLLLQSLILFLTFVDGVWEGQREILCVCVIQERTILRLFLLRNHTQTILRNSSSMRLKVSEIYVYSDNTFISVLVFYCSKAKNFQKNCRSRGCGWKFSTWQFFTEKIVALNYGKSWGNCWSSSDFVFLSVKRKKTKH